MRSSRRLTIEIVTALTVVVAIGGLLVLNATYQSRIEEKNTEVAAFKNAQDSPVTNDPAAEEIQPAIAFTPDGLFDEAEKTEITTKLLNPYIEYQKELSSSNDIASIHVRHPQDGESLKEYIVDVLYFGDVYAGFIYGDSTSQIQPWWQPQCFEECEFSEAYQQKYPEVVKQEDD